MNLRRSRVAAVCLLLGALAGCHSGPWAAERRPIDFEKVITTAKEKVFPALVFVKPIRERFEAGEKEREQVFGSGVIISADGLVVTNHHVVDKAIEINCVLGNKQQVPAELIGEDKETDLALIKLKVPETERPLPYARFADSDKVTEGQFVMALGAPFGFTRSISLGILSNTRRYIGFQTVYKYNLWLQTDAAINPGNSGGPLVNTDGEIVGINTLGLMFGGMGFSIPSNEVAKIVARLKKDGKVIRAWTGIEIQALNDFDSNTFTKSDDGVLIKGVEEDSPALRAGLQSGDILLECNGAPVHGQYVEQLPPLRWALADLPADKPAKLVVRRKGERVAVELAPVLKGAVEGQDFDCRRWNMTVKGINKYDNPELYFYRKEGVFIRATRHPGNADNAGLRRNDIIVAIDGQEIRTIADVKRVYEALLADEKREKKVLFSVLRTGLQRLVVLDYRKDYDKED